MTQEKRVSQVGGGIEMQTTPAADLQVGDVSVKIGEAFVIAGKDESPQEGAFVFPSLYRFGDTLFVNWQFDRDILDPAQPAAPNGRLSRDGGISWERQTTMMPRGYKYATGVGEITSYWGGFEIPRKPGHYRVATWRSFDNGKSWGELTWTEVHYPGTKGLDIYDPPEGYKKHSANYKHGFQRASPPAYLEPFFKAASRRRGPGLEPMATGPDGAIYSLVPSRYLDNTEGINDWETEFWERLDWTRHAVLLQTSRDRGRTWSFGGVVAYDAEHKITEFDEEDCFSEPALAIWPDGEMVCLLRVGSFKPLYLVRSRDGGKTWSQPIPLPIRGVYPILVLLPSGVLALSTGRPDCTIHFSLDRGVSWPTSHTLFVVGDKGPAYLGHQREIPNKYAASTCYVPMVAVGDNRLLCVHDASHPDPHDPDPWLQRHGHGLIVGRLVTVHRSQVR